MSYAVGDVIWGVGCLGKRFEARVVRATKYGYFTDDNYFTPASLIRGSVSRPPVHARATQLQLEFWTKEKKS